MDRTRRTLPVLRIATAAGLVVLLGFLIVDAAQRGVSFVHWRQARSYIEAWEKARKSVDPDQWKQALAIARDAERLTPRNPDTAEILGQIYDWGAFGKQPTHISVPAYHRQALRQFRLAAQRRPVSGYTWANIAQQKAALGQIDREFVKALELTDWLAPWEPEVQLAITDVGFAAWQQLDAGSREITKRTATRALRRYAAETFVIARQRGRIGILCEIAGSARTQNAACK